VVERPAVPGLFGTDDPSLVLVKAAEVAGALARVVRERKLYASISGTEHVLVGGWTLLGSMLGVYPVTVWSRPLEDGWEARVEARTRDGAIVGAAESECLRSERRWAKADDYAIRSMAQTRATSKALRLTLGFVMELAGFDATPADEVPADGFPKGTTERGKVPAAAQPTVERRTKILELLAELKASQPDVDWAIKARELAGVPYDELTQGGADGLIRKLRNERTRDPRGGWGKVFVAAREGVTGELTGTDLERARRTV
jgi:hypothetical protein